MGPDPYEGLNARRGRALRHSAYGRRLLIQTVKRSPVDLRGVLGIPPAVDAATLAHVLSAHARLAAMHGPADPDAALQPLISRLLELRCRGFDEPCWGYHFDVETRFFFYGRGTPNTIATSFAGHALLDAHLLAGDPGVLDRAKGVARFFLRAIALNKTSVGGYFGYFPGDHTPIHNASLLAASFLARLVAAASAPGGSRSPAFDEERAAVRAAAAFALEHQHRDGSWPYAEGSRGAWVDGFHTGYVIDALTTIAGSIDDPDLVSAIRQATSRGLRLYEERLLLDDGTPRYFVDSTYPIDGQSAAQAIRTFSLAGVQDPASLDVAWRAYAYAVAELRRPDGAFAYQRGRLLLKRIAHPRWVQAPMLEALSLLLYASARSAPDERVHP